MYIWVLFKGNEIVSQTFVDLFIKKVSFKGTPESNPFVFSDPSKPKTHNVDGL